MREFGVTDSRRLDDRRPSFEANTADLGVVEFDPAFENVNELEFERVMVARLRNVLGASRANNVRADATARRGRNAKIAVSKERTLCLANDRLSRDDSIDESPSASFAPGRKRC